LNSIVKFIPLPTFGDEEDPHVPKDFNPKENFFLSQQRFQILKEVIEKPSAGLLLVGPHGVGKSSLTYFVACYAWLNRFPLIYIVCPPSTQF
jgi:DNA replication protein DnaC